MWKWPHRSVTLRHISMYSTVCSTFMCVGSQYDTGTSCSTVSGLRWSWLKFNSSVYLFCISQCSTNQIVQNFGIRNWIWLVKNSFSHDICNARNACTASVILWTGLMCGSRHTKFWILIHTQLHCYTSLDTGYWILDTGYVLHNSDCYSCFKILCMTLQIVW